VWLAQIQTRRLELVSG